MTIEAWPEVSRRQLAQLKVFDVISARRRSPRTGGEHEFFVLDTRDWVNIVAITVDATMLFVRQYRHGTESITLEIPGGVIERGEDPALTAARELREETGFAAGAVTAIGEVLPNPAIQTNRCYSYLATDCRRAGELQQDAGEDIEVVEIPIAEVDRLVLSGEINHALALNGLYFWRLSQSPAP